jgi:hypothetical protein
MRPLHATSAGGETQAATAFQNDAILGTISLDEMNPSGRYDDKQGLEGGVDMRLAILSVVCLLLAGCASAPSDADLASSLITITYVTEGGFAGGQDLQWAITTDESSPRTQGNVHVVSQAAAADCVRLMRDRGFFGWRDASPPPGTMDVMKHTLTVWVGDRGYTVVAYDAPADNKSIKRLRALAKDLQAKAQEAPAP